MLDVAVDIISVFYFVWTECFSNIIYAVNDVLSKYWNLFQPSHVPVYKIYSDFIYFYIRLTFPYSSSFNPSWLSLLVKSLVISPSLWIMFRTLIHFSLVSSVLRHLFASGSSVFSWKVSFWTLGFKLLNYLFYCEQKI